jgi:urease accessory protein
MSPNVEGGGDGLARLLTWLSPAFPVGGYSYSHGLEYAVERGLVRDLPSLIAWIEGILRHGSGRNDAILLDVAWRAQTSGDAVLLADVLDWAEVFRGTAELALESAAQGRAFLDAVRAAWPDARLDALAALAAERARTLAYPVAVGVALAIAGIAAAAARRAYLHAFAANLVSAGVRLIPLGQSDGLRTLAALEGTVAEVAQQTADLTLADLGGAAWMVDLSSARHETQYTRLFRS